MVGKMSKHLINIAFSFMLSFWCLCIWVLSIILAGDIPVKISLMECLMTLVFNITFTVVHSVYTQKTKSPYFSIIFLALPTFLWVFQLLQELKYHYHIYSLIITFFGSLCSLFLIGFSIYRTKFAFFFFK